MSVQEYPDEIGMSAIACNVCGHTSGPNDTCVLSQPDPLTMRCRMCYRRGPIPTNDPPADPGPIAVP